MELFYGGVEAEGYVGCFEAKASGFDLGEGLVEPAEGLGAGHLEQRVVGALAGRLLVVAEVGGDKRVVPGDDEEAGRAAKPGEVEAVLGLRYQEGIESLGVELSSEPLRSFQCAHSVPILTAFLERVDEQVESREISPPALTGDLTPGDGSNDRYGAELLTGVDVG